MALIAAPFTGDRSKVKQISGSDKGGDGVYLDQGTGNYFTGTWDSAVNWGKDLSAVGKSQPTGQVPIDGTKPTTGAGPNGTTTTAYGWNPKSTQNPTSDLPGAGGAGGYLPFPNNPYANLPTNPYAPTTPSRDGTAALPTSGGSGGTIPPPPAGFHQDPNTGAWVWNGGATAPTVEEAMARGRAAYQQAFPGSGAQQPSGSALDFIKQWQGSHSASEGIAPLADALRAAGYSNVSRFMYGQTPSNNELMLDGQKWKVLGAEDNPNTAYWYQPGQNDSPAAMQRPPTQTAPGYTPLSPTQTGSAQDAIAYLNQLSHSMGGGDLSQAELAQYASMVGYKEGQPVTGAMVNQIAAAMRQARGVNTLPPTTPPPGGSYTPTNPFDDPATKSYIDLLNERIKSLLTPRQDPSMDAFMKMIQERVNGLNTPYNNPDAAPLQEWMRKYFAQLQGPTYTDAQRDTIQTQALDPLERQRQARKQQAIQQIASRGLSPDDGVAKSMLADIDRQFDQQRAQTQSGLAVNEINTGRQNQAAASGVGGALAQFTQGQFSNNENRANEAVSLFGAIPQLNLAEFQAQDNRANQAVALGRQIPDMAQARLQQAIGLLNGSNVNPASLIGSLQGFQQQGINQNTADSAYWQSLIANIAKIFGL